MQKDEVRLEYIHSATKRTFEQNQAFNILFNFRKRNFTIYVTYLIDKQHSVAAIFILKHVRWAYDEGG